MERRSLQSTSFINKIKLMKGNSKNERFSSAMILKTFVDNAIKEQRFLSIKQKTDSKPIPELLIDELQKSSNPLMQRMYSFNQNNIEQKKERMSTLLTEITPKQRNIDLILFGLQNYRAFLRYINFYGISYNDLRNIAVYLKYKHYPKGSYIYLQHQKAENFYGIIKGSVSVRVKAQETAKSLSRKSSFEKDFFFHYDRIPYDHFMSGESDEESHDENMVRYNLEQELKILVPGMCFGESSLLKNTTQNESVYCLEETDIFYLDKTFFDIYLKPVFIKAIEDRKFFLKHKIPILSDTNFSFETPEFYDKGSIIYTQFQKAKDIFVVFQGECALKSFQNAKNEEDINNNKDKMVTINILDRGGIAGLESVKEGGNYYEKILVVIRDFTVLYRLNVDKLCSVKTRNAEQRANFKEFFLKIYKQQTKVIETNTSTKKNCSLSSNNLTKKFNFQYEELFEKARNDKPINKKTSSSKTVTLLKKTNNYTEGNKDDLKFKIIHKKDYFVSKGSEKHHIKIQNHRKSRNIPPPLNHPYLTTCSNEQLNKAKTILKSINIRKTSNSISKNNIKKSGIILDTNIRLALQNGALINKINVYNSGYFKMPMLHCK